MLITYKKKTGTSPMPSQGPTSVISPDGLISEGGETLDDPGRVVSVNNQLHFALHQIVEFLQERSLKKISRDFSE